MGGGGNRCGQGVGRDMRGPQHHLPTTLRTQKGRETDASSSLFWLFFFFLVYKMELRKSWRMELDNPGDMLITRPAHNNLSPSGTCLLSPASLSL